jgi:lipoic acid synthetase
MVGLGETKEEVIQVMDDLRAHGCDVMTIGQYLQPTRNHLDVLEWITPEQFKEYEEIGLSKGFRFVESGPLVRSSYHAEKHIH